MLKSKNIIISLMAFMLIFIIALTTFGTYGNAQQTKKSNDSDKLSIVTSLFVEYDLTRQIVGDKADVELLLIPNSNYHFHTMTEVDKQSVADCDLFIYTREASDGFIKSILTQLGKEAPATVIASKGTSLRKNRDIIKENAIFHPDSPLGVIFDLDDDESNSVTTDLFDTNLLGDYDTHVWTSVKYAKRMCKNIFNAVCELDKANIDYYTANYNSYCAKLDDLDVEYCKLSEANYTDKIYFAGNFAFYYMCERYGIDYESVVPYCGASQQPNEQMLSYIIDQMKKNNVTVFYYDRFDNEETVNRISSETGAKAVLLYSAHAVTKEQLDEGISYLELMQKNLEGLKLSIK